MAYLQETTMMDEGETGNSNIADIDSMDSNDLEIQARKWFHIPPRKSLREYNEQTKFCSHSNPPCRVGFLHF